MVFSWFWVVVGGLDWLPWFWLGCCGWFWLVLGGCGLLWVVVGGFGLFLVLVCTIKATGWLGPEDARRDWTQPMTCALQVWGAYQLFISVALVGRSRFSHSHPNKGCKLKMK